MYVCLELNNGGQCTNWQEIAFYAVSPIPPDTLYQFIGAVILLFSVAFALRFVAGLLIRR